MASIAVLPVLIGLAVDYAIQFQARFNEARAGGPGSRSGRDGGRRRRRAGDRHRLPGDRGRLRRARALADPDGALLRAAAGRRGRARLRGRRHRGLRRPRPGGVALERSRRAPGAAAPARRLDRPPPRRRRPRACAPRGSAALAVAIAQPGAGARGGGDRSRSAAGSRAPAPSVVSDIRDLAPSSLPALRDVNELQEETGVSGEVDVVVRSDDLTDPEVIAWMRYFQQRVLERARLQRREPRAASTADLCPAVSLTDLFGEGGGPQSEEQVRRAARRRSRPTSPRPRSPATRSPAGSATPPTSPSASGCSRSISSRT